ncbi:phospholipase D-like domain-containing protein [Emcibacter sp. SYSU 3D8]|uniref:phospholipase D-like domain-containing protein n=1 Tax=Emcibacter sp. SYSU 3D8 TaxID=3133969 RepID=UPI0031FE6D8A
MKEHLIISGSIGAVAIILVTILVLNLTGPEKHIQKPLGHFYGVSDPQFMRELGTLLGPPVLDGNSIEDLQNGDAIFPSMLAAIRGAQHTITFETYIYWSGQIGLEFREALVERATAGVKVHVLLDWVGSQKMDGNTIPILRQAGVEVELYHPLHWYSLARMNNRTHRKLLVVDGRVGFTGGVGIADQWRGNAQNPDYWRDSHYRVEGPAVAQIQAAFADNWMKTSGRVLQGDGYFPPLQPAGEQRAQMFISSPRAGGDSMQLMYLFALAAAERTIDLSAAYFVPDDFTRSAMIAAIARGVRVRIIVPGKHIDTFVVGKASRETWGELLQAGAEIHVFQPTMFHCKMLVVDDLLVSVGSTNFDNRSFRLNDEANLNIYDHAFALKMTGIFEADLKRSTEMTLAEWQDRPLRERLMEKLAGLFSSQL